MRKPHKHRRALGTSACRVESLEDRRLLSGAGVFAGGSGNAMAMAGDGTLYLAYYVKTSSTTGSLNYAIRDAAGNWSAPAVLDDASAQVGLYVTMALDSTGKPGIAYYDGYNADLKYAHWNGTSWDTGVVYTTNGKRGNYPSLAYHNDKPTISSYVRFNDGSGFLAVNQYSSPTPPSTPSGWSETQVDDSGWAGRHSSIVYNSGTGKWGISYTDSGATTQGPRYVESSGSSVTSGWGTPVVVPQPSNSNPSEAIWTRLAYDSSNRPSIGFYNEYDADAVFAQRSTTNAWSAVKVDVTGITGKYPDLRWDASLSKFRFSYYDQHQGGIDVKLGTTPASTWVNDTDLMADGVASDYALVRRNGVNTFSFSDAGNLYVTDDQAGVAWTKASGSSAFLGRYNHASVVFDEGNSAYPGAKMWVLGGFRAGVREDVWASSDGYNWRNVRTNGDANHTGFTARAGHAAVVFDGKMWVLGGQAGPTDASDVGDAWYTTNGLDWTKAQVNGVDADFGARRDHNAVVFDGKMFVIGGVDASGVAANPVVSSADGLTWTAVTDGATAGARYNGVAVVYKGSIFVTGNAGSGSFDTYKSNADGTQWTRVGTPNVNLAGGQASVYDGKIWVVTGTAAYWSTDGISWTPAATDPDNVHPFDGRNGMTVLTFAKANETDRLWTLGGYVSMGQSYKDEVWSTT